MIHVAIDARLPDQGQGGVQQVIRSFAEGFQQVKNSDVRRSWIVYKGTNWWKGVLPPEDELIFVNPPFGKISLWLARRLPKLVSFLYPILNKIRPQEPPFDRELTALQVGLVHMPFQDGFTTGLPYIYHPHDLQHKFFPENFTKHQIKHRESVWRKLASEATVVMAANERVSSDLIKFWNIDPVRIAVTPIPPPTRKNFNSFRNEFAETPYIIYPAVFWPHKNHMLIVNAMTEVVANGNNLNCIFTGASGTNQKRIKKIVRMLRLEDHIHFLGHVPDDRFSALLHYAEATVIPSIFEASSLTVYDSINVGTQVLCSDIPIFREQCGNAVIYFDPYDASDLSEKICNFVLANGPKIGPNHHLLSELDTPKPRETSEAILTIYKSLHGGIN